VRSALLATETVRTFSSARSSAIRSIRNVLSAPETPVITRSFPPARVGVGERAALLGGHTLCSSRARDDVRNFRNPRKGQPAVRLVALPVRIDHGLRGEVPRSPVPRCRSARVRIGEGECDLARVLRAAARICCGQLQASDSMYRY
jgi:hypothetical protein